MCGRYTLARSQQELSERFGIKQLFVDFEPRYNIAPTQMAPVVINDAGENKIELFRWGLIPSWMKEFAKGKPLINARAETLTEKASFRNAFKKRRCLVPADGFYEWKQQASARNKSPFYICSQQEEILAFAGIWEEWNSEEGGSLRSFAIITCQANEEISSLHERMPVIIPPALEKVWLENDSKNTGDLLALLRPCPESYLRLQAVCQLVNSVKNDSPECRQSQEQLRLF